MDGTRVNPPREMLNPILTGIHLFVRRIHPV